MASFYFSAFADEAASSLDGQIAALRENGIGYIEPRNIDGKGILDLTETELHAVREKLDAAGIKVGSLGSPIGKYPIHEPFDIHQTKFEKALLAARILGTKQMRMFSFFVNQDELDACRDEVLCRLRLMAREADAAGITLCHENESAIYGQMPAQVSDLLDEIPQLVGIFDPANYVMNGADPMAGIRATFKHFRYMHIKDALFAEQTIVPAGEGEGRIGDILDLINEHTDDAVMLTLEPHLHVFDAYAAIDKHELKGKYQFENSRAAFDFAVASLEKVLKERGYRKDENNQWRK